METKKITAQQIMDANIADESGHPETYYIQYKGIPIAIKGSLSLLDILKIADNVASFCFMDDGEYMPELKDFFFKRELIETATNIELPEDIAECYDLIMNSDLGRWVDYTFCENLEVYRDLMPHLYAVIQDKMDYMADSGLALLRSRMDGLVYAIENLSIQSENMFGKVSPDDMEKLISSVDSLGKIDEKKLVKAFTEQERKSKPKSRAKKKPKEAPALEVVK